MKFKFVLILSIILMHIAAFGQDNELDKEEIQVIQKLIKVFKSKNKVKIADYISYPLSRQYPLKNINSKNDFIKRFDEIFDNEFLNKIANSTINDWSEVGWRGIMFDNGDIWIDMDGKITAINYQSNTEEQLLSKAVQNDKNELPKSLQNFKRPVYFIVTKHFRIRIDELKNQTYRYAAWKIKSNKSEPDLVVGNGAVEYLGSGGNHNFSFKNNEYTYTISINVIGANDTPDALLEVLKDGKVLMAEGGSIISN